MRKILRELTQRDLVFIFIVLILTCAQIWLDLRLPEYMSGITMLVQTEGSAMGDILISGFMMLLCALFSLGLSIVVALVASYISANFSYNIRGRIFKKVMSFSMKEINEFSASSLITRTTNDITQVQLLLVMGLHALIKAPITAVWAIYKISGKNGTWTFATVIAVLILLIIVGTCIRLAVPKFKQLQEQTDEINRVTKENLDGLSVVRAYNAENYQNAKFKIANDNLTNTHIFTTKVMSVLMPTVQGTSNFLVLSIYLLGASLINAAVGMEKMVLFSDMVVFSSYAMQVIMSFMMLVMVFMMLPRATVSAQRICEVLETDESIISGTIKESDLNKLGEIEFKNVSFKYGDGQDYVLKDINFVAKRGETVAFIGATGCGKTTLINLVPRFYDVSAGEVLVGGVNVRDYEKTALNNLIGYVSQKAILFSGTISRNISYGGEFAETTLNNAVDVAQATEFISKQHNTHHGHVAQGGSNFSGGQKQRLSIARAIYKNPPILIFDDSFSALDYKTDRVLRSALNETCKDSTRLIIGQRIGTIRDCDKIIVLDDGIIVGMGKHAELLKTCEVYKQIALSQLSEEELA
ncbi:multidrug ABC transporter ATP-binding protein [Candidatus Epulonipiscioides gigas]|nr:multidrug ABC transporter ATP-binding protein [Epulopiscium sp. SCG-C07WGA-EpuloA2]